MVGNSGKLDRRWAEVTASARYLVYQELTNLPTEIHQICARQTIEVARAIDSVENTHGEVNVVFS